ncbi:acetyl-CoA carboxylase biotin carboxyl carrier protein subunit [Bradyrhizobium sp. 137]|uniref:acetyl-CoA carboxylase biotin carboxyl carrier protein subunit n=1 Tax=Bradyrhizobium sp. 137 TaxID=2782614 RepID=UPI001FFB33F8|nr:acetyl-CoA carboxylase biotin carboxyl carrier protein subunit [Bradyrhizobium sp. 137]
MSQAAIGDVNADARAQRLRQQTLEDGLRQSPAMHDLTRIVAGDAAGSRCSGRHATEARRRNGCVTSMVLRATLWIVRRLIPVEHGRDAGVVDPQQPNPFGMAPREVSGFVWRVETELGRRVAKGETPILIEPMKMEIPVVAEADGVVVQIAVEEGGRQRR